MALLARLRLLVDELEPDVVDHWERRIDELRRQLDEEDPDDGVD